MHPTVRIIILCAIAWFFGLFAYVAACRVLYHQGIAFGELLGVAQLSLIASACAFGLVYIPAMLLLRRLLRGSRQVWIFPLLSIPLTLVPPSIVFLLFAVPATLLNRKFPGRESLDFFVSQEASLFYCMFGVAGLIIGCGFACIHYRDNAA